MLRFIGGVVGAYVAMASVVIAGTWVAYRVIGTEGAFQPGAYDLTALWIAVSFVLGFLGALLGGWVCARIARNRNAVLTLAGLVLVFGLFLAIPILIDKDDLPHQRPADLPAWEAMRNAPQPAWIALLNPLVGAIAILIGGGLFPPVIGMNHQP